MKNSRTKKGGTPARKKGVKKWPDEYRKSMDRRVKNYKQFQDMANDKPTKGKKRGAPVTVWTDEFKADLLKKMEAYTETQPIPILAEFAYLNKVHRQDLYAHDEFSDAIKNMMAKKESALEKGGLFNKLNPAVTIFSLKQLGWKDKQTITHDGSINHTIGDTYKELAEILGKLKVSKELDDILKSTGVATADPE